jgi:PAS domain-containing protein
MTGSLNPENAEAILAELDGVFLQNGAQPNGTLDLDSPNVEARYRALVEQIPAVVFMAYLDKGMGEAYVSRQIEKALGFSQREWLEHPIRWYQQVHPDLCVHRGAYPLPIGATGFMAEELWKEMMKDISKFYPGRYARFCLGLSAAGRRRKESG